VRTLSLVTWAKDGKSVRIECDPRTWVPAESSLKYWIKVGLFALGWVLYTWAVV